MSVTYGATGESVRSAGQMNLADDDDYEYLLLPDVDEDYLDSTDVRTQVPRRIPFSYVHEPPQPFESRTRSCFLPGQKITVVITKAEKSDVAYVMNPYLYYIEVKHGDYNWTVCRRYKHFSKLHDQLMLLKTKAIFTVLANKDARERRRTLTRNQSNVLSFPKRPDYMIRHDKLPERLEQLQGYLQSLLKCSLYRNHQATLEFLEVSQLSFISGLGSKLKEGLVEKQAGGRRVSLGFFSCLFCCQSGNWQERWLVVKDSFVAYIKPSNGMVRDVILMDRDFKVRFGLVDTGVSNGLLISNMSRNLLVKAYTDRKVEEWFRDINSSINISGCDYIQPNPHDSFVPIRQDSYVNWFVDGASYMAAVADALEAAREEIFITDWMLSPELYLKRPNMEKDNDRWRLDLLLQRKAKAGVKIFILIYKEIELAVGINSYYTKHTLMSMHENIRVLRHPDGIKLWSHHEKCVVIDQRLAFLGGIDLCYGRWDTRKHRLTDYGQVLTNIYGNQDDDTLQNVLTNRPNIVPKISELLQKVTAKQNSGANLSRISEVAVEFNNPDITVGPGEINVDINPINKGVNSGGSIEVSTKVVRDEDGGYTNPAHIPTPAQSKMDIFGALAAMSSSGETEKDKSSGKGKAKSDRKQTDKDSRNSESGSETESNGADITGTGIDVTGNGATGGGLGNILLKLAQAGPEGRAPEKQHSTDENANDDDDEIVPDTLKKFLKNFVERKNEIQATLDTSVASGKGVSERAINEETAAIQEDRSGHLNPDMPSMPTQAERKRMRDQFINIFGNLRSSFRDSGRRPSTSRRDSVDDGSKEGGVGKGVTRGNSVVEKPRKASTKDHGDGNRPKEELQMESGTNGGRGGIVGTADIGNTRRSVTSGGRNVDVLKQAEPKPSTPTSKKKMGFKTVAMLVKSESIDVTDDTVARHWNENMYLAKEADVKDQDLDDQLTKSGLGKSLKIWVGKDYVNFIFKDFVDLDNPFTDMVDRTVTPRMPWHDIAATVFGKPARDVARHFIQRWNYTKLQKMKMEDDIPMLLPKSNTNVSVPKWAARSMFCCDCQILRSSCEWSAGFKYVEKSILNTYIDLIENSKHYIYIENQFFITINRDKVVENGIATALYERIVKAHKAGEVFRVYVVLPLLPAFEGQLGTSTGTSIQAVTHWNYQSICRGGESLLERLASAIPDPFQYVSFFGLRKHDEMLGTLVTELIYVHSKLMIVDDNSAIIASANINDRSMLGYRDSELGILVKDTRTVDSLMNGKPYKAGAFAGSLRKSLFREHLGLESDSKIDVSDPISDHFYKNVWLSTAAINTTVYDKVFRCLPTDDIQTLREIAEYERQPKLCATDPKRARKMLKKVRGHLVFLPLLFLVKDSLTPAAGTKEALAPTVIWT